MNDGTDNKTSLIISYLQLRKAIGILGLTFPLILFFGAVVFFDTGIQSSISSYYYTGMQDVFVGTLCVIGFFLLSYKGYERADDIAGDLGCVFAVCVAIFPTTPDSPAPGDSLFVGYVHLTFAALFFLTLIYLSLFLFTKTDPKRRPSKRKMQRNTIYKLCGYVMSFCILLIILNSFLPDKVASYVSSYRPVFWLESTAVVAFGISWLTKGEAILKDEAERLEET